MGEEATGDADRKGNADLVQGLGGAELDDEVDVVDRREAREVEVHDLGEVDRILGEHEHGAGALTLGPRREVDAQAGDVGREEGEGRLDHLTGDEWPDRNVRTGHGDRAGDRLEVEGHVETARGEHRRAHTQVHGLEVRAVGHRHVAELDEEARSLLEPPVAVTRQRQADRSGCDVEVERVELGRSSSPTARRKSRSPSKRKDAPSAACSMGSPSWLVIATTAPAIENSAPSSPSGARPLGRHSVRPVAEKSTATVPPSGTAANAWLLYTPKEPSASKRGEIVSLKNTSRSSGSCPAATSVSMSAPEVVVDVEAHP